MSPKSCRCHWQNFFHLFSTTPMPLSTTSSAPISKISVIGDSASVSVNYLCTLLPLSSFRYNLRRLFVPLIAIFEVKMWASSPFFLYWFDQSCGDTNQKKNCTFQPPHCIEVISCTSWVNFSSVVTRQEHLLVVTRAEHQACTYFLNRCPAPPRHTNAHGDFHSYAAHSTQ